MSTKLSIKYECGNIDSLSASERVKKEGEAALMMLSHLTGLFYFVGLAQHRINQQTASEANPSFEDLENALETISELGQAIADGCFAKVDKMLEESR